MSNLYIVKSSRKYTVDLVTVCASLPLPSNFIKTIHPYTSKIEMYPEEAVIYTLSEEAEAKDDEDITDDDLEIQSIDLDQLRGFQYDIPTKKVLPTMYYLAYKLQDSKYFFNVAYSHSRKILEALMETIDEKLLDIQCRLLLREPIKLFLFFTSLDELRNSVPVIDEEFNSQLLTDFYDGLNSEHDPEEVDR
jgi:hypothetical protein